MVNHFWKRWSVEYITSLNKYSKWTDQKDDISIEDIVILCDEVLFPIYWPLARVINVHPEKDNLIQVVTLKTSKGIYKRPVTKIVVLVPKRPHVQLNILLRLFGLGRQYVWDHCMYVQLIT